MDPVPQGVPGDAQPARDRARRGQPVAARHHHAQTRALQGRQGFGRGGLDGIRHGQEAQQAATAALRAELEGEKAEALEAARAALRTELDAEREAALEALRAQLTSEREAAVSALREAAWALRGVGFYALAGLFVIMALTPLLILFKVSISGPEDVLVQHPPFWIHHPTAEHWQAILKPDVVWPPHFMV